MDVIRYRRHGEPVSIVPRERMQIRAGEVLKTRIELDKMMIAEAQAICDAYCISQSNLSSHDIALRPWT